MRPWLELAGALLLAGSLLSGCDPAQRMRDVFTQPVDKGGRDNRAARAAAAAPEASAAGTPRRDPMPPAMKTQTGIDYDQTLFEQGAYRPDNLENMINSKGFDGISQQTFAEAGGDNDVDVDRTGKLMVFSTTRYSRNPDICLQSVRGKAVTLHTNDPADDMMPSFSPDGQTIAWCSNRYGNWDILVSPTNRTARTRPQQVTRHTEDDIHPVWSPDAVWSTDPARSQGLIAFSRYSAMDGVWRIWVLDVRTRSLSAITEGLFPEFRPQAESRDGRTVYTLAFQRNRKRDVPWFSVWQIDVAVNEDGAVEVANAPTEIVANDKWAAINPTWSPDGEYLAFASVRKSPSAQWQARIYKADDIWVVRRDGTDLTQITSHSAPDWSPCWAADEQGRKAGRIFFTSLRNGHDNVWSVSPIIAGMLR